MMALFWLWLGVAAVVAALLAWLWSTGDLLVGEDDGLLFASFCVVLCLGWPVILLAMAVDQLARDLS